MPLVSLVIPVKNEEKLLPELLKTVRAQTLTDYEIIVADAHSTDRTAEVAKSFGARVVEGGMPGPGRNKGALHANGEFIFFVDADAQIPSSRFLEDSVAEMKKRKIDVATCILKPMSEKALDHIFHHAYNAYVLMTETFRPHSPGSCIIVRRHVHEKLRGFDEEIVFAEDMEYSQRARKNGFRFRVLRSHPISVSVRRLEKDGHLSIAWKYMFGELHMMIKGPIKKLGFEYEMGGDEPKKKKRV